MAHLGTDQSVLKVRLSSKDAISIRKLARDSQISVSEMVRYLIRRARVARKEAA